MANMFRRALAAMTLCATASAGTMYAVESTRALSTVNLTTGVRTPIGAVSVNVGTPGGLAYNPATATMYVSSTDLDSLFTLDLNTGIATLVGSYNDPAVVMHGLEFHDATGQLYGVSSHNGGLYLIDAVTGNATLVGPTGATGFVNLGYNADSGVMYGTSAGNDSFYMIDHLTGSGTLIGPLLGPTNPNGLAYNRDDGMLYLVDNTTDTLYIINLPTGMAQPIGSTGAGNILGLAYVPTVPPPVVEVFWAAAVNGSWGTPGNWNPAVVPNNSGVDTYNAIISAVGVNPYTVTLNLPVTVNALDLLSPVAELLLGTQTLNVLGDFRLDSTATLSGLMPGSAEFTVGGDVRIFGGTIAHVPKFNSNGRLLFLGSMVDGSDAGPVAEICDSNVGHNGPQVKWTSFGADGGPRGAGDVAPTIKLNMGAVFDHGVNSTFLIESDAVMMQQSVPTFTSVFNNAGTLRKQTTSGVTDMLDFVFNNTGTVDVVTGTLRINGVPLPSGALQTGTWSVRTGATLTFVGQQVLTNQANILLDGPSSSFAALSALRTNAGSGVLEVRGRMLGVAPSTLTFTNSGVLRMGPGGLLNISGFFSQHNGGTFRTALNGAATTANYGRIAATSSASLAGALVVALENGFNPDWGDTYVIATYASRTGNFTSFTFPGLSSPNLRWWRENNAANYRIGVRHVADTNHDGVVNFTDLNNVLSTFGQSGAGLIGDCDENGTVNFTDLNLVLSVFGQSAPPN